MNDTPKGSAASAKSKAKDPSKTKMKDKEYLKRLEELQVELCYLQEWVKDTGARIILLFEGRDAAGKGGIIKAIMERVSPRVFRDTALPAPTNREKTELYMQRYIAHFPAGGEIVIFDRSWYNRAGVEPVLGFCTEEQHKDFLEACPVVERWIVRSGIILIKIWLEVGQSEQERRFKARIHDPLRQWKLSPTDLESFHRWYDYSLARDSMLKATDTDEAPWVILRSDDKKRARLNGIAHILSRVPYKRIKRPLAELPTRASKHKYDDEQTLVGRRFVESVY
jgi:polyphosphate kinase 2